MKTKLIVIDRIEDMVELGKLKNGSYRFTWSPPGASNLPIRLFWRQKSWKSNAIKINNIKKAQKEVNALKVKINELNK